MYQVKSTPTEEISVKSADGLTLNWPANTMFETDPYSAFVKGFENAYHGARAYAENMNSVEYNTIMQLAELLITLDPATDDMLDTSSM